MTITGARGFATRIAGCHFDSTSGFRLPAVCRCTMVAIRATEMTTMVVPVFPVLLGGEPSCDWFLIQAKTVLAWLLSARTVTSI
jgi:hypothetical protein